MWIFNLELVRDAIHRFEEASRLRIHPRTTTAVSHRCISPSACLLHGVSGARFSDHFDLFQPGSGSGQHSHSSSMPLLATPHSVYGLMTLSLEDALESTAGVALLSPDGVDALAFSIAELTTRVPRFD